ncbi:MAG: DUF4097 family beta strand repeat-containing protein [Gammaproteobacteria bacterium]
MVMGTFLVGLAAAGLIQDTDTTFTAGNATRLDVESVGGEVIVEAWDRDDIHVQAEHSRRSEIEIHRSGRTIYIEGEGNHSGIVDYRISVPRTMDVSVEGFQTSISLSGMGGEVDAETFQGGVEILGGSGTVSASTVSGSVLVDGAEGRVTAEAVSGGIRIRNTAGEITAESVSGSIVMEGMSATSVEAETVSGRVSYTGTISADGDYFFGTHGGRVTLELPRDANAELRLASLSGTINVEHAGATDTRTRSGRRSRVQLGDGGPEIEIETFSGTIVVREIRN